MWPITRDSSLDVANSACRFGLNSQKPKYLQATVDRMTHRLGTATLNWPHPYHIPAAGCAEEAILGGQLGSRPTRPTFCIVGYAESATFELGLRSGCIRLVQVLWEGK